MQITQLRNRDLGCGQGLLFIPLADNLTQKMRILSRVFPKEGLNKITL